MGPKEPEIPDVGEGERASTPEVPPPAPPATPRMARPRSPFRTAIGFQIASTVLGPAWGYLAVGPARPRWFRAEIGQAWPLACDLGLLILLTTSLAWLVVAVRRRTAGAWLRLATTFAALTLTLFTAVAPLGRTDEDALIGSVILYSLHVGLIYAFCELRLRAAATASFLVGTALIASLVFNRANDFGMYGVATITFR